MIKAVTATLGAFAIGTAGFLGFGQAGGVEAQPRQQGLVNVNITDTTVQVPIGVAANICDLNVNALAEAIDLGEATCGAENTVTAVDNDGNGGGPANQEGLVNLNITNLTVQIPIGIAANVCDVNANVLARGLDLGESACRIVADTGAEA
jgi:hypothetical protein